MKKNNFHQQNTQKCFGGIRCMPSGIMLIFYFFGHWKHLMHPYKFEYFLFWLSSKILMIMKINKFCVPSRYCKPDVVIFFCIEISELRLFRTTHPLRISSRFLRGVFGVAYLIGIDEYSLTKKCSTLTMKVFLSLFVFFTKRNNSIRYCHSFIFL